MKCETQILTADRAKQIYERFKERSSKDDEYNDWAGYREELTDFVVQCTRPGGSLLILGAGKCNDLDLRKLAEHCGSITLSDYRQETVEEAFRRYGLAPSGKLGASIADYVSITDEDYLEYTERLLGVMEKLSGDAAAKSMGVAVDRLRFVSMLLASVITAVCVSFLGIIGFVGIICPHVTKRLLGQDHRVSIPASALSGSILLLLADTASRSLGNGSALPVGAITSLLGAPFFLAIIFSRKGEHG